MQQERPTGHHVTGSATHLHDEEHDHGGRQYHLQIEDLGVESAEFEVRVYVEGSVQALERGVASGSSTGPGARSGRRRFDPFQTVACAS